MKYGDKRNYRKIDIYYKGIYQCSTTWSKTCKEAKTRWLECNPLNPNVVTAQFAK